jgi:hypothetical protein
MGGIFFRIFGRIFSRGDKVEEEGQSGQGHDEGRAGQWDGWMDGVGWAFWQPKKDCPFCPAQGCDLRISCNQFSVLLILRGQTKKNRPKNAISE